MTAVDESILLAINGLRAPWIDPIAGFLGEWGFYLYPAAMIVILAIQRRAGAASARDGMLAFLLSLFVTESIVKPLIARPRPTATSLLDQLHVLGAVPSARSFSMPSGSATACAAGAAWIWIRFGPRLGVPAALLAVLVGLARIYAGIHWPSDVVVGLALGAAIAFGVDRYARWAPDRPPTRS